MMRIEVLDHNERHGVFRRQTPQQIHRGFKSAC
jgi:hypothetical protein